VPGIRDGLLQLLYRWRKEASQAGRKVKRIAVAYGAGRDGFWLARWLRAHGIESHVIHPSSIPVSREHRRAKTDRLDAELLKRAFLGWLRGEPKHCSMAAIPTTEDEDARRPSREREILVKECTRIVNRVEANLARLGIRGFRPALSQALKQLETVRTPEGSAVPANTLAEVRRDIARRCSSSSRSKKSRGRVPNAWNKHLEKDAQRWCGSWLGLSVSASRALTCLCKRYSCESCEIARRWHDTRG
jgi:transposase